MLIEALISGSQFTSSQQSIFTYRLLCYKYIYGELWLCLVCFGLFCALIIGGEFSERDHLA